MEFFLGTILYILLFVFFKINSRYFHPVKKIVFLAIGVRYFFALYHWYIGPFPIIGVLPDSGNDETYFIEYATNFPSSMIIGWLELISFKLYPALLGLFFKVFGAFNFVGSVFNSFFGIIIMINVYRIYKLIWGDVTSKKAVWIFLFLPMQAAYSVILIREAMFTCFLTTSVYCFMIWYFQNNKRRSLYLSLFFLLPAILLHDAVVITLIPMIYYILNKRSGRFNFYKLLVITTIISVVLFGGILSYTLKEISEEGLDLNTVENLRNQLSERDRTFGYASETKNPILLVTYFTLRPYIWEYQVGILRIFNTLLIYLLLVLLLIRLRYIRKNPRSKMLLIFLISLLFVYAIGSGDLNQSDRHRSKILPLIIALVPYRKKLI